MNIQELKSKYARFATERSGCWLLEADTALKFLADLSANGLPLNGIEGYWLTGNMIEPSMEHSIYFIGEDIRVAALQGHDSYEKARHFIEQRKERGLLFDFDFGGGKAVP